MIYILAYIAIFALYANKLEFGVSSPCEIGLQELNQLVKTQSYNIKITINIFNLASIVPTISL